MIKIAIYDKHVSFNISLLHAQVHYKGCTDMPLRTKAAQAVFFKGELHVGGGYVTESKMAAVIHKFEPVFQLWDHLPTCPLKQFGMASFENNLVAVGGKEVGNLASNKIYTLDEDGQNWNACIPPMTFARVCPVVIGYEQFLIVAGGKKGSLDYNLEIYDHTSKRWTSAPPLPTKCYPTTSVVSGHSWYLLNQDDGTIKCADIRTLISQATGISLTTDPSPQSENTELKSSTSIWLSLPSPPSRPIQITAIGVYLLAITCESNPVKVRSFLYNKGAESWCYSNKLPNLCGSSSALPDDKDGLYLFGGEGGSEQYSNKLYKLTLRNVNSSHLSTKPPISFCL